MIHMFGRNLHTAAYGWLHSCCLESGCLQHSIVGNVDVGALMRFGDKEPGEEFVPRS